MILVLLLAFHCDFGAARRSETGAGEVACCPPCSQNSSSGGRCVPLPSPLSFAGPKLLDGSAPLSTLTQSDSVSANVMCGPPLPLTLCDLFCCVRLVLDEVPTPPPSSTPTHTCIRPTLALSSLFRCWRHRVLRYDGSRLQVSDGGTPVHSYAGDAELFSPLIDGQPHVALVASTDGGDAQQHSVSSLDVSSAFAAARGTCSACPTPWC